MDSGNVNVVATGDAAKVSHSKPRARVDDKNVQNVDFLDIMNRLTAKQASNDAKAAGKTKANGTSKTEGTAKAQRAVGHAQTDEEVLDTLDEIISEYGAENLNADILMSLMSMYTTDSSVNNLLTSDDPMEMVQSSLYSAVLDNTSLSRTGGEMIEEIGDGCFDDLVSMMGSTKTLNSILEVLASVQDADELERALRTISGITVTSEINEVDRTVNVLSEQLNLSNAVKSAKASLENDDAFSEVTQEQTVPQNANTEQTESNAPKQTEGFAGAAQAETKKAQTAQSADVSDAPTTDTAAQAMGFVDYGRGTMVREALSELQFTDLIRRRRYCSGRAVTVVRLCTSQHLTDSFLLPQLCFNQQIECMNAL